LFEIFFANDGVKKDYENLEEKIRARINGLIEILKDIPVPFRFFDVSKVAGRKNRFRIRIGKFRVIYHIEESERRIYILQIEQKDETTYKHN